MSDEKEKPNYPSKKSLENLKPPWKKGQSGNPAGRPKGARGIKAQLRTMLKSLEKCEDPATPIAKLLIRKAFGSDTPVQHQLKAVEMIMDRLEGKATQTIQTLESDPLKVLSDEELAQIKANLKRE